MDLFEDAQKIYSPKTREYFKEVISSYANGNYRSAIVMLYSVCLCDLLFKLEELKDMYNDSKAKGILHAIEQNKTNSNSKSSWEKELVDEINKKTELLDLEAYTNLSHLYSYRNLSAHPILNGEHELISPNKEVVAAYIRVSLDTILLKPAIFIKDIVEFMTNDLDDKRGYLIADKNAFKEYIKNRYLDKMSNAMYQKVFRTFWRFTFKTTNEDCDRNRYTNMLLLTIMYSNNPSVIKSEIENNIDKYDFSNAKSIQHSIINFFTKVPSLYTILTQPSKVLIDTIIQSDATYELVSWFTSKNKRYHIKNLIKQNKYIYTTDQAAVEYMVEKYEEEGLIDDCLEYLIKVVGRATTYTNAGERIEHYIFPFLEKMQFKHFELLFSIIEDCDSLKNNHYLGTMYCPRIWKYAKKTLPEGYDMSTYPHFKTQIESIKLGK